MPQTSKTNPSKPPKPPKPDSGSGSSSKKKCSRNKRLTEDQSSDSSVSTYGGIGKYAADSVYGGGTVESLHKKQSSKKAEKAALKRGEKQAAEAARR
jgi:hypothetical protein